jgi:Tfp pilus assembly protein PilF
MFNENNVTNMIKTIFERSALAAFVLGLTGCTSIGGMGKASSQWNIPTTSNQIAEAKSRTQTLAESGTEYLVKGELEKAQQVFNTALKFDIKSVPLHFFNALTYQTKHEKGDPEAFKLAEAGYKTALKLDPSLDIAFMQLGHLYMSVNNYAAAQKNYVMAIDSSPNKAEEPLYFMAKASLLLGDSPSSAWAVKKLNDMNWQDARLLRLKIFQAAVAAKSSDATDMLAKYLETEKLPQEQRYVKARLSQLLAVKASMAADASASSRPVLVAAETPASEQKGSEESAPDQEEKTALATKPNWFTCDKEPRPIIDPDKKSLIEHSAAEGGDEGYVRYALPMPCNGEAPPTAVIEVTMIRTEEKDTQSYGINLLEGLKVSAMGRRTVDGVRTGGFGNKVFFNEGSIADELTGGLLTYNMNIANALYEKNEVVARPTLSAIDRLPSVFFSGSNYSVQVGNSTVGYTLADKQVGISLSVTPTFVDDNKVLLSIRASRSFMEPTIADPLNPIKLTQTRNTVSANALLNYGETFVLNGLVERERDKEQTGTPLFQEIPILQYFFKRSITIDYNRQVLTLVTVRKLVNSDEEIAKAKNKKGLVSMHKLSSQIDAFIDLQNSQPVLDEVLASLSKDNGLYQRLKARDLIQESVSHHDVLQRIVSDAKQMFYY